MGNAFVVERFIHYLDDWDQQQFARAYLAVIGDERAELAVWDEYAYLGSIKQSIVAALNHLVQHRKE